MNPTIIDLHHPERAPTLAMIQTQRGSFCFQYCVQALFSMNIPYYLSLSFFFTLLIAVPITAAFAIVSAVVSAVDFAAY